ncbi:Long-chain-fatty-acid--CoA ligase FadD15 [compost metagenome]
MISSTMTNPTLTKPRATDGAPTPRGAVLALQDKQTLSRHFWARSHEWADRIAMREKIFGVWQEYTWADYGARARLAGMALRSLGVKSGECVTIMSESRSEWLFAEMGAQCIGGISVGIYTTDSEQQVQFLLGDCRSVVHIVEDDEQLDKILAVREQLPHLRKIVVLDTKGLDHFDDPQVISYAAFEALGRSYQGGHPDEWETLLGNARPSDTAMLIYTSGTTGQPKGAMLTHANLVSQFSGWDQLWQMKAGEEQLCFLPLCHVAEQLFSVLMPMHWGTTINFAEGPDTVSENIREVSPHAFLAVPRVWEKFFSSIDLAMKDATWVAKKIYQWGLAVGYRVADCKLEKRPAPLLLRAQYLLARVAVLRPVKTLLGLERAHFVVTGAAPISPALIRWYLAIGVPMREAYGMTETTGLICLPPVNDFRLGYVGAGNANITMKITDEGEILLKGPNIFKGYFNLEEASASAFTVDGWFKTGDVGMIDDGQLRITDRLKDILITSGGKNVTPSLIESELKFSPYITDAVVIGDKRKYLTCLVMIDQENVARFAQDHNVPFTDYGSLCARPEVVALIDTEVQKINAKFARVEQIKKFRLIAIQLDAEDEELTPTMKLKRSFVNKKYAALIDAMYKE